MACAKLKAYFRHVVHSLALSPSNSGMAVLGITGTQIRTFPICTSLSKTPSVGFVRYVCTLFSSLEMEAR